jgi:hypothetical protein
MLEEALEQGERVVWAGKPDARIAFLRGWVAAMGFVFVAGILLTVVMLLKGPDQPQDAFARYLSVGLGLVGAAFAAVGLLWPFLSRGWARRTVYAITTGRALDWSCDVIGRVSLTPYEPAELAGLYLQPITRGPSGVGNLIFSAYVATRKTREGTEYTNRIIRHGFFLVPHAAAVERLLRETLIDPFLDALHE